MSKSAQAQDDTTIELSPMMSTLLSIKSSRSSARKLVGAMRWNRMEKPQCRDTCGNGRWIFDLSTKLNSGMLMSKVGVAVVTISKSFAG